jgi:4'-phosphopantetheinyl transferase EntD
MITTMSRITAVDRKGTRRRSVLDAATVPVGTTLVELHTDGTPDLSRFRGLHAAEQRIVRHAVALRKSDFGDARWCAHEALRQWGSVSASSPVLRGAKGMPLFPPGVVGTLSHTEGLRAALVGPADRWRSMGIDVERAVALPGGVFNSVTSPAERWQLEREAGDVLDPGILGTVLFSAKECVYKSWFPLAGRFLDFDGAEVTLSVGRHTGDGGGAVEVRGTWTARLLVDPTPVDEIHGMWVIRDGYVATVCAVATADQ